MAQRDKEHIEDFRVRYDELVGNLREQKYIITPDTQWDDFQQMILRLADLRLRNDITSIDAAVDYLSKFEIDPIKNKGMAHNLLFHQQKNKNKKEFFTHKDKKRCPHCCSTKHTRSNCWGLKKGLPPVTLSKRLELEKKHRNRPGLNNVKIKGKLQKQIEKQGQALSTLLNVLGARTQESRDPTLDDVASMLNNVSGSSDSIRAQPNTLHPTRKVSMTNIGARNRSGSFDTIAALWDSGAMPESYINLHTVKKLGLQKRVKIHREEHKECSG
jgi:hypothetical protein